MQVFTGGGEHTLSCFDKTELQTCSLAIRNAAVLVPDFLMKIVDARSF
jgi:hypothetical protein